MTKNKGREKRFQDRDSQGKKIAPRPSPIITDDDKKPLFSLEYIGINTKYGLKSCQAKDKAIFLDAIHKRSGLTWKQIKYESFKDGLGWEFLKDKKLNIKLRNMARKKLTDDAKIQVFCAKARTKKRMLGERDGQIFYILFLDPLGETYEH